MVEHLKDAGEVVVPARLRHYVILGGVYADTPAQRKQSKWLGHSAYLGCGHCMLLVGPNGHGMSFQGYTEETASGNCFVYSALLRSIHVTCFVCSMLGHFCHLLCSALPFSALSALSMLCYIWLCVPDWIEAL